MWLGVLIAQLSCKHAPGPQQEFERIRTAIVHDDLVLAQQAAEAESRRFLNRDSQWFWKFRLLEAEALTLQGLNAEVLTLLSSSLPSPLDRGNLAVLQNMDRGLAFARLGNFQEADKSLVEAERLCAARCDAAAELARTEGAVEAVRNNMDAAETFFRRSLQLAHRRGDWFVELTDSLNLGVVAIGREHFDESIDWSSNAQRVSHQIGAGLAEEKALGNLGWAYYKIGDFERSLDYFKAANEKARALGAIIDQVKWLNNVGLVYFRINQIALADAYYQQSLELAEKSQNQNQIVAALTAQAFVAVERDDLQRAQQCADRAFDVARKAQDFEGEGPILLVRGRIAERMQATEEATALFSKVIETSKDDLSLRWQAQDDLAKLYEQQGKAKLAEAQFRNAIATFESARSSLHHEESKLPFLTNAADLYDDYIHFLVEQGRSGDALQVADYDRALTLSEGLGLAHGTARNMRGGVNPQTLAAQTKTIILFYELGFKESYLWAITPRNTKFIRLPPASEIDAAVQNYRKALAGPRDVLETANPDGIKLFDMLVQPAVADLPLGSRIVVAPDGSLNNLNFETLLVSGPKLHYWIDDVTIVNTSSLRLLSAAQNRRQRQNANILLIGDAVVPDPAYGELPKAELEISDIEKHFGDTERQVYTKAEATASAYLNNQPERFGYIHFVAHGTASRLSPLDSAVILSSPSGAPDSFKLYARDIIRHPLRADLVTISSCNGSGVRAYTGEGLVGLSWAFLRAGAHNVIGALWEVSDASTPQLMDQLYTELGKGGSPAVALRTAKLSLLHSESVFRKPFYWAPFQLYTGS